MRGLRSILEGVAVAYNKRVMAAYKRHLRADADEPIPGKARRNFFPNIPQDEFEQKVRPQIRKLAAKEFDRMWNSVYQAHLKNSEVPKIAVGGLGEAIQRAYEAKKEANIQLVENAGRSYSESVRKVFTDPSSFGKRVEDISEEIQKAQALLTDREAVSASRADLIARDQTLKTLGTINETRQTAIGITQYRWVTSRDERVRGNPDGRYPDADPSHYDRDGEVFDWDSPPEGGHPGEDFQCRCIAVGIIPELE